MIVVVRRAAGLLLVGVCLSLLPAGARAADATPQITADFVPNRVCAGCHKPAFEAWRGSHHDRAMQIASEDTVLGDFDDRRFELFGVVTRFFRRDGRYFVNTEGPDGKLHDYQVGYTFGVDPLQQYLIELPGGRMQALTIAWDVERKRWYSLYPHERIEPDDALHWTGVYQNWNAMCAECHSTNLDEGYDLERDTFDTTWSEIDVSCQACHGPGSAHVAWARAKDAASSQQSTVNGLLVSFTAGDGRYQVEQCARCHSRREPVSVNDAHGRAFMDDFAPATLRPELYHADGQIDGEVYVYGSFVQSRMHAAGVRCSDCHEPHALTLKAEGNALCTRCHQAQPDPRFAGLKARNYDSTDHHFHAQGSEAARCVSCHMPGKTYMGIDFRRDHSFRIPRPDVSVRIETPNACTGCHDDRSPQWAADEIAERATGASRGPHFGEILAAARRGDPGAGEALSKLAGDRTRSAMVRASALGLLGNYGATGARVLALALSDPDPLVRLGAVRGLAPLPPHVRAAGAAKLIDDPVRAVRSEAARTLAPFAIDSLPNTITVARARVLEETVAAMRAHAALPGGRLALAALHEQRGDDASAERLYRAALASDRHFQPARFNLSTLLNRLGRNAEAEEVLREGVELAPEQGELHYSLGLLLAEQQRMPEAVSALEQAAARLPGRGRVHYNLALALEKIGRNDDALRAMTNAHRASPNDADVLRLLTIRHVEREQWRDAERYARQLLRVRPGSRLARQVLARIEALASPGRKQ